MTPVSSHADAHADRDPVGSWPSADALDRPVQLTRSLPRRKRALDMVVATLALVAIAPAMAAVAVAIRLTSSGPVIFRQVRVGLHGRPFVLYKFRTMRVGRDDAAHRQMIVDELKPGARPPAPDGVYRLASDDRITPIGTWLRRTSFDELPQLWNVLTGSMSLVGPRPALPWEVELFDPRFRERENLPPGITGLWQVSGRNLVSTPAMLELDLQYVQSWSLRLDLSILARTPGVLLRGDGAR